MTNDLKGTKTVTKESVEQALSCMHMEKSIIPSDRKHCPFDPSFVWYYLWSTHSTIQNNLTVCNGVDGRLLARKFWAWISVCRSWDVPSISCLTWGGLCWSRVKGQTCRSGLVGIAGWDCPLFGRAAQGLWEFFCWSGAFFENALLSEWLSCLKLLQSVVYAWIGTEFGSNFVRLAACRRSALFAAK